MRTEFKAVALALLLSWPAVGLATVINLNLELDPEDGPFNESVFFSDDVPVAGTFGDFWRAYIALPSIRLESGDKLNINVTFTDSKLLHLEDRTGTFNPFGLGAGNESFFFFLKDVDGRSGDFATFEWTLRLLGARGDLNINPAAGSQSSTIQDDLVANYTDSSFGFRGMRLTLDFESLDESGGPVVTDWLQFDILAEQIRITQLPEPDTLALFGLGLAGLAFARRRRFS